MCFVKILLERKYYFDTEFIALFIGIKGYQEGIYVWLTLLELYPQY